MAVGEFLSKWISKPKPKQENLPIKQELENCKANIIPAHTDTLKEDDNLTTIGRKNNVSGA